MPTPKNKLTIDGKELVYSTVPSTGEERWIDFSDSKDFDGTTGYRWYDSAGNRMNYTKYQEADAQEYVPTAEEVDSYIQSRGYDPNLTRPMWGLHQMQEQGLQGVYPEFALLSGGRGLFNGALQNTYNAAQPYLTRAFQTMKPGSSFWMNPMTKGMLYGTAMSKGFDLASNLVTNGQYSTFGEHLLGAANQGLDSAGVNWQIPQNVWTEMGAEMLNPGWWMNPDKGLTLIGNTGEKAWNAGKQEVEKIPEILASLEADNTYPINQQLLKRAFEGYSPNEYIKSGIPPLKYKIDIPNFKVNFEDLITPEGKKVLEDLKVFSEMPSKSLNSTFSSERPHVKVGKALQKADSDIDKMNTYHDANVEEYNQATGSNVTSVPFRTDRSKREIKILPKSDFIEQAKTWKTNSPSSDVKNIGGVYSKRQDTAVLRSDGNISNHYHEFLHSNYYGETNPEVTEWRINQLIDPEKVASLSDVEKKYYLSNSEFPVHLRQFGESKGIEVGQPYPGDMAFDALMFGQKEGFSGASTYAKGTSIDSPSEDKQLLWKALNGTLFGATSAAALGTLYETPQEDNTHAYGGPLVQQANMFGDGSWLSNLTDRTKNKMQSLNQRLASASRNRPRWNTTGGAGYIPTQPLSSGIKLSPERIYNRIPGDQWYNVVNENRENNYGVSGVLDAVRGYLSNEDNYVKKRLQYYSPYKDISWKDKEEADKEFYKRARGIGYRFDKLSKKERSILQNLDDKATAPLVIAHEDAKDEYLGLPQRFGTLKKSEYYPTQGKLNNGKYITYMRDPSFVESILLPTYNDFKIGKKRPNNKKYLGEVFSLPSYTSNVVDITPKGNAVVHIPFLNNATMSSGYDDRGEYMSIYDTWDYNTKVYANPGDDIGQHISGKPFDIYDRYYLDDVYGVKTPTHATYLPEVEVVNNKAQGGSLNTYKQWQDLPIKERADIMKVAIRNGITNLADIKAKYNEFALGGQLEESNLYEESDEGNMYSKGSWLRKKTAAISKATKTPVASKKSTPMSNSSAYAMQYFINKGLAPHQAAGLVGNLMRESGLNPLAINPGSKAYGLAQWLGARKKKLFSMYGNKPTLQNQLDFVWWELNNTHKNGLKYLMAARNAEEAARAGMNWFEFSNGDAISEMNKWGQDGRGSMRKGIEFATKLAGQPMPDLAYLDTPNPNMQQSQTYGQMPMGYGYPMQQPQNDNNTFLAFEPSNPQAFFAPLSSYETPVEQPVTQPLVDVAEQQYKAEMAERQRVMQQNNNMLALVSYLNNSGNQDSSPFDVFNLLSGSQIEV